MKKLVFIVLLCAFVSSPALADLFNFTVNSAQTTFNAGTSAFSTTLNPGSSVTLTRDTIAPTGSAFLLPGTTGSFLLNMQVGNIDNVALTATGTGAFTLTDIGGNTLTGSLTGKWNRDGSSDSFHGTLSNVNFSPAGGTFVGDFGAVSMSFPGSNQPWSGAIVELTAEANWFGAGSFDNSGGSVGATVVPVPVAVLLGLLGLGTAGLKLRKVV